MNDQLNVERPSGFRNAVYGMMGTMMVFGISTIWYGSQIEARFDARLTEVEREQSLSRTVIEKLNDAREESRVHGAQVDAKLNDVNGKLSAILEIIQQPVDASPAGAPPESGGTPNAGPGNFHLPPHGRGH